MVLKTSAMVKLFIVNQTANMRKIICLTLLLILNASLNAQKPNPGYDPELAKRLGADELGMKMYVLVLLKTGPNNEQDSIKRAGYFKSHFDNINKMAAEKKLVVAGPLDNNALMYRGIFIMDVPGIEEAKKLVNRDLTVKEGIFEAIYIPWYGSAALPEYLPFDNKLTKTLPE